MTPSPSLPRRLKPLKMIRFFHAWPVAIVFLTSCASFSTVAAPTATSIPPTPTTAEAVQAVLATQPAPKTLTVWLPPDFRPDSGSEAAKIFKARLDAYRSQHSETEIVVRLKAVSGPGGLRDSLAVTAAAAPSALPDLILLDQSSLRAAVLKELVYDIRDLAPDATLFPYATAISGMDGAVYGVPFAGDAMVLASRNVLSETPPSWTETLLWSESVHLPLADSRSLFPFLCYFAAGGSPFTTTTALRLDPAPLEKSLTWISELQSQGLLSADSLQIDSLDAALNALSRGGGFAVTRYAYASTTRWINTELPPTPDGSRFTLATGWSWAMANPDSSRRREAADLLAWLSDPEFQGQWTLAQGMMPVSKEGLQAWPAGTKKQSVGAISQSATPFPADEIAAAVGPLFNQAIRWVLIDGITPAEAAVRASQALNPG